METQYKYATRFDGLLPKTNYNVTLSTELDGKTITQVNMAAVKSKDGVEVPEPEKKEKKKSEKKKTDKKKK